MFTFNENNLFELQSIDHKQTAQILNLIMKRNPMHLTRTFFRNNYKYIFVCLVISSYLSIIFLIASLNSMFVNRDTTSTDTLSAVVTVILFRYLLRKTSLSLEKLVQLYYIWYNLNFQSTKVKNF